MGCQQICCDFIRYLSKKNKVNIPLVLSYDLPEDKFYNYESVIKVCKQKGIKVITPKFFSNDIIEIIKKLKPDIIFSVYYRKIIPSSIISIPSKGIINIHPSLLPFYRGPVPTAWSILYNEKYTGITIHKIDKGIDTGDILIQKKININNDETGFELYTKCMSLGSKLLIKNFNKIINNKIKPNKQKGIGSYYGKLKKINFIDWKMKRINIKSQVRTFAKPYNPMQAVIGNYTIIINKVILYNPRNFTAIHPGKIVEIVKNKYPVVSCADGCLMLVDFEIIPKISQKNKKILIKKGIYFD